MSKEIVTGQPVNAEVTVDYGRTKIDDHAKTAIHKTWVVIRWFLWVIGLITVGLLVALAAGVYAIAT